MVKKILNILNKLLNKLFSAALSAILFLLVLILVGRVTNSYIINKIDGQSMEPSFYQNDFVISTKLYTELKRGDVIEAYADNESVIKRVIGLPGETVIVDTDNIYVNGYLISSDYRFPGPNYYTGTYYLGDNEYFIVGDHKEVSKDSRYYGPVTYDDITSIVVFRIWFDGYTPHINLVH